MCLMPFARNDATRSISPTKALEYMAAGRPIVSAPIPDVVAAWSDVITIADTPERFIAAVAAALAEPHERRDARAQRQQTALAAATWDSIVARMAALLERALPP